VDNESDGPTCINDVRPRSVPALGRTHSLAVVSGPASGTRRVIDGAEIRVGKAPSNDLCLTDPTVSRFHCVVERTPRGLLLRDLGSFNGTQVGGCHVESAYLSPDVPIQLGNTVLRLVESDEEPPSDVAVASGPQVLGSSRAIRRILSMLPRLALSGANILLEGETGTGKSMVAELIHRMGPRVNGPFVVVDCGALAASLVEGELFGHERGSFTGASERRMGAFEAAEGGTVFLDEIGELPLEMQPRLLRALEERTVRRIGTTRVTHIDVQIIAATNRDLRGAVAAGQFRPDLYYRLDSLRLVIPPLRERPEDVPALIDHFCQRVRARVEPALAERMKTDFVGREWPGNVRELRNAVEKAVLMDDLAGDTPPPMPREEREEPDLSVPFRAAKEEAMEGWERRYLAALIRRARGNISEAARLSRLDRGHLRELFRQHGILPERS
jgi:transcriptional regulator with GAF, ATPase, and Fis domain